MVFVIKFPLFVELVPKKPLPAVQGEQFIDLLLQSRFNLNNFDLFSSAVKLITQLAKLI